MHISCVDYFSFLLNENQGSLYAKPGIRHAKFWLENQMILVLCTPKKQKFGQGMCKSKGFICEVDIS